MNFLKNWLNFFKPTKKEEPIKEKVFEKFDVGSTIATITLKEGCRNNANYYMTFTGYTILDWNGKWDDKYINRIIDSDSLCNEWISNLKVFFKAENDDYIPVKYIESISSKRESYIVEVEEK